MSSRETFIVVDEDEGARLDKIILSALPDTGLRFRRRLCDDGRVLVEGRPRKPGYKVRAGQEISITREHVSMDHEAQGVAVVEQSAEYAAVYKPGGVHSAVVEGKDNVSVEAMLPGLLGGSPVLLNRLDFLTSGLLVAALIPEAADRYRAAEKAGTIKKFYLAEVMGRLDGVVTVKRVLDTDDRKTTRVLGEDDGDHRRWTGVETLSHDHEAGTTMARCLIMKGARHQIRAHLASIGHPIVGDPLYGEDEVGAELRLQHQRIEFPGFTAEVDDAFRIG